MAAEPTFELLGFTVAAATAEAAIVQLEGRLPESEALPGAGAPATLVVEDADGRHRELEAVAAGAAGNGWRASFAVPIAALDRASFALDLGRLLVELPAPDVTAGDPGRLGRLAREANALRRRLEAAEARAAEADALRGERDELRGDLARAAEDADRERSAASERLAAAESRAAAAAGEALRANEAADQRVAAAQEQARGLRADLEAARAELAEERQAAEANARALRESLDASRDETAEVRRTLKRVRAELENLQREQARPVPAPRTAAARVRTPAASPRREGREDPGEGVRVLGPVRRKSAPPPEPDNGAAASEAADDAGDDEDETEILDEPPGDDPPTEPQDRAGGELLDDDLDTGDYEMSALDPDDPQTEDSPAVRSAFEPGLRPRSARPLPPAVPRRSGASTATRWIVAALLLIGIVLVLALLLGLQS
jgi:hypothetical protein